MSAPEPLSPGVALSGVDEIDWAGLDDAYGTASLVPQMLHAAGGDDADRALMPQVRIRFGCHAYDCAAPLQAPPAAEAFRTWPAT